MLEAAGVVGTFGRVALGVLREEGAHTSNYYPFRDGAIAEVDAGKPERLGAGDGRKIAEQRAETVDDQSVVGALGAALRSARSPFALTTVSGSSLSRSNSITKASGSGRT